MGLDSRSRRTDLFARSFRVSIFVPFVDVFGDPRQLPTQEDLRIRTPNASFTTWICAFHFGTAIDDTHVLIMHAHCGVAASLRW